jgi:hypothetical protein
LSNIKTRKNFGKIDKKIGTKKKGNIDFFPRIYKKAKNSGWLRRGMGGSEFREMDG